MGAELWYRLAIGFSVVRRRRRGSVSRLGWNGLACESTGQDGSPQSAGTSRHALKLEPLMLDAVERRTQARHNSLLLLQRWGWDGERLQRRQV